MNIKIFNNIKKICAYIYLYIGYFAIFYFFAYYTEEAATSWGTIPVIMFTLDFFTIYIIINHRLIKSIIPHKILVVYEALLIITLVVLLICYNFLWTRYGYLNTRYLH